MNPKPTIQPHTHPTRTSRSAGRTGKIARLPNHIREELNHRLRNGETTRPILDWLNALPEVRGVLKALFESRPINPCNLSEWRRGGYRDWLLAQNNLNLLRTLQDLEDPEQKDLANSLVKKLSQWTALLYAANARAMVVDEEDPERRWQRLRELSVDISRFRRSEIHGERVALDRESLALDHANAVPPQ